MTLEAYYKADKNQMSSSSDPHDFDGQQDSVFKTTEDDLLPQALLRIMRQLDELTFKGFEIL